jgi:hypothetical protein
MLNNRLSAKFTSTTTTTSNVSCKNKKAQPFHFLRSKPPVNPSLSEETATTTTTTTNEQVESEEFLEADQFDFDQVNSIVPTKATSTNSSLSSSRLSLPVNQCNFYSSNTMDKNNRASTKQRIFNFIYNTGNPNSGKIINNSKEQTMTNQQRRLSDFHRPTVVSIFKNFI